MSFWEVQYGIVGGIAVSGALLLYSMARPQIEVRYLFMSVCKECMKLVMWSEFVWVNVMGKGLKEFTSIKQEKKTIKVTNTKL